MKYSEILEVIRSTEFAVKNGLLTKEDIDKWEEVNFDQFDIEYDVDITEDEWADFCELTDRLSRQVAVAKHMYGDDLECGDEDEI